MPNYIAQYIPKPQIMLGTGNLVTSMINYMELRNFWDKITLYNPFLKSHIMLVTGISVTPMIHYVELTIF